MLATRFRKFRRGSALVTVLMVVALSTLFASALVGFAFFNLNTAVQTDSLAVARNLADTAIGEAAYQILASGSTSADPSALATVTTYPTPGSLLFSLNSTGYPRVSVATVTVTPSPSATDTGYAMVTFSSTLGLPVSVNNLNSNNSTAGWGRVVPGNALHLIAKAYYKSAVVQEEAIIYRPPFPYAIAAAGQVTTSGQLLVAGIPSGSATSLSTTSFTASASATWLPADIGNNSSASPYAMVLGSGAPSLLITGNVLSGGKVDLAAATNSVQGSLSQYSSNSVPIPTISASWFDPDNYKGNATASATVIPHATISAGTSAAYPTSFPSASPILGWAKCNGDLYVDSQGLNLNGGVLYVNGNLTVQGGGIQGTGAIFTTGSVNVLAGSSSLSTDSLLALVSGGNITMSGAGTNSSNFKGVIYSGGNLSASNITLVGSYVSAGGSIALSNTVTIQAPDMETASVTPPTTTTSSSASLAPATTGVAAVWASGTCSATITPTMSPTVPSPSASTDYVWSFSWHGTVGGTAVSGTSASAPIASASTNVSASLLAQGFTSTNFSAMKAKLWLFSYTGGWTSAANSYVSSWDAAHPTGGGGGSGPVASGTPIDFSLNEFLSPTDTTHVLLWQTLPGTATGWVSPSP